jgi:hypothetical protein
MMKKRQRTLLILTWLKTNVIKNSLKLWALLNTRALRVPCKLVDYCRYGPVLLHIHFVAKSGTGANCLIYQF